ncbi:hypothetical protein PISMIDRAFT_682612 [Pisolithus microcarpus 441]|uniref:Uncharacterized protein n=1 Tax=Pisolithus microcarpus 441 TaxID=765257 RepID=A0A0C9Z1D9_9AGAM|nr:hypothetical protein PISMIDRAFT_682612 [Pisolithus microcarpus 441]
MASRLDFFHFLNQVWALPPSPSRLTASATLSSVRYLRPDKPLYDYTPRYLLRATTSSYHASICRARAKSTLWENSCKSTSE